MVLIKFDSTTHYITKHIIIVDYLYLFTYGDITLKEVAVKDVSNLFI